ncbi:MAG TPA: hypothetical protein VGN72_04515 [Tepidisphaeraceae bacterium]|jgi:hypothetical protein|nr:hypothetical protein [Tepidisphaeraceae bacterium]
MRSLAVILSLGLITGCASHRDKTTAPPPPVAQLSQPSAALAFDVPGMQPLPEYVFARDLRQHAAYVGFDTAITTYAYVRTDDRQYIYDRFTDFERQAVSAKMWVSTR